MVAREARRRLWPVLDGALERVGGFATATVPREGYVGSVRGDIRKLERELAAAGFSFGLVAALKDRVCPAGGEVEAGSWVCRDARLARHQLHVHLFDGAGDGYTDVYAHHEPSWIRHPLRHVRVEDCDHARGVDEVRAVLAERGVAVERRDLGERCQI